MMSNDTVTESACDDLRPIFRATNEALSEWTGEGNLQFPKLLEMLALKLNWGEKQLREADVLVRWYVRRHPDWHVTRGAHGGIMRASEKQKKEAAKLAKICEETNARCFGSQGTSGCRSKSCYTYRSNHCFTDNLISKGQITSAQIVRLLALLFLIIQLPIIYTSPIIPHSFVERYFVCP